VASPRSVTPAVASGASRSAASRRRRQSATRVTQAPGPPKGGGPRIATAPVR
jgi:hypothetical protein